MLGGNHLENQPSKLIDLYKSGLSIKEISSQMEISEEEVLNGLREYRDSQKTKGRYTDEFMKLIAKRDCHEVLRKDIMSELGISRNFLSKAIEQFGFLKKMNGEDSEEFYAKLDRNFDSSKCPECKSKRVNHLNTLYNGVPARGMYCISCGSEFVKHDNNVYRVKWENVD